MTRDEVLERLDRMAGFEENIVCGGLITPAMAAQSRRDAELLRAAAELIRQSGWRPIAEAPSDRTLILVGRWHRGKWQWKETWFAGQATEDGYTHYLPEPAPPAREVENDGE